MIIPLCEAQGYYVGWGLALSDGADRASVSTAAAGNALLSVDDVAIFTLGDDAKGAGTCASTALQAAIVDNICHDFAPPFFVANIF